jgi:hypothetical protein
VASAATAAAAWHRREAQAFGWYNPVRRICLTIDYLLAASVAPTCAVSSESNPCYHLSHHRLTSVTCFPPARACSPVPRSIAHVGHCLAGKRDPIRTLSSLYSDVDSQPSTQNMMQALQTAAAITSEYDLLCQVMAEDILWLDSFRSGMKTGGCQSALGRQASNAIAEDVKLPRVATVGRFSSHENGSKLFDDSTRSKQKSGKNLHEHLSSDFENRASPTSVANESIDLLRRASSTTALGKRGPDNSICDETVKKQRSGKECGGISVQSLLN